jgi:hypothetical protein
MAADGFCHCRLEHRADPHLAAAGEEELPEERQSRFLPFMLGAAVYAALLIFGA